MSINTALQITDAFPTGTGAIVSGCAVDLGIEHAVVDSNVDLGTGVVSTLGAYDFAVSGNYSFDLLVYKGSGTFQLSISSPDSGQTWAATAVVTGTWNINISNVAVQASETGSGTDTAITYRAGSTSVVQTFQNDGLLQKAKVYLSFTLGGKAMTMYMYNLTYYGDTA